MVQTNNLISRDLRHIWHPCSQMKDYEDLIADLRLQSELIKHLEKRLNEEKEMNIDLQKILWQARIEPAMQIIESLALEADEEIMNSEAEEIDNKIKFSNYLERMMK